MICAFGSCKHEHDLWIKPEPNSEVVPICRCCAESESETYHLSHEDSKDPNEVDSYRLAYDPDTALTEQLIDMRKQIEDSTTQYEGDNQQALQKLTEAKQSVS